MAAQRKVKLGRVLKAIELSQASNQPNTILVTVRFERERDVRDQLKAAVAGMPGVYFADSPFMQAQDFVDRHKTTLGEMAVAPNFTVMELAAVDRSDCTLDNAVIVIVASHLDMMTMHSTQCVFRHKAVSLINRCVKVRLNPVD